MTLAGVSVRNVTAQICVNAGIIWLGRKKTGEIKPFFTA